MIIKNIAMPVGIIFASTVVTETVLFINCSDECMAIGI